MRPLSFFFMPVKKGHMDLNRPPASLYALSLLSYFVFDGWHTSDSTSSLPSSVTIFLPANILQINILAVV